jgi:hypothetical protein
MYPPRDNLVGEGEHVRKRTPEATKAPQSNTNAINKEPHSQQLQRHISWKSTSTHLGNGEHIIKKTHEASKTPLANTILKKKSPPPQPRQSHIPPKNTTNGRNKKQRNTYHLVCSEQTLKYIQRMVSAYKHNPNGVRSKLTRFACTRQTRKLIFEALVKATNMEPIDINVKPH